MDQLSPTLELAIFNENPNVLLIQDTLSVIILFCLLYTIFSISNTRYSFYMCSYFIMDKEHTDRDLNDTMVEHRCIIIQMHLAESTVTLRITLTLT